MTLAAIQIEIRRLSAIRGQVCCQALVVMQGVSLGFGQLGPPGLRGHRRGDWTLAAESPWRLEDQLTVLAGSGDENADAAQWLQILVGKRLRTTNLVSPSHTLLLRFDGGLTLWLFPDSRDWYDEEADYKSPWYIFGRGVPEE